MRVHKIEAQDPATRYDSGAKALSKRVLGNERREIMHRPVRFADDIEPLVQFIEETDPSRILEATLAKLRDGLSVKKVLTASALAVTRSSDLPPGHHGGPLHPPSGSGPTSPRARRWTCCSPWRSRRTRWTITTSSSPCSRGAPSTGWVVNTRRSSCAPPSGTSAGSPRRLS